MSTVESSAPLERKRGAPPLPAWRAAGDYLRQLSTLGLFFLINVVLSPPAGLLSLLLGDRIPSSAGQRLIAGLVRFWLRYARLAGTIRVDFPEAEKLRNLRGVVVAPNHPSLIDAIILLGVLPRAVCVMRADLAFNPVFGGMSRMAGFVPNDRGRLLVRGGLERIRRGENLLIFPEGTRTRTGPVNAFKKGFALIAVNAGAPIQTIFIEREGRYLSKHLSLLSPAALPVRFRLHLGEVIHPQPGESASQLAQRVERYFRERVENAGADIRLVTPALPQCGVQSGSGLSLGLDPRRQGPQYHMP